MAAPGEDELKMPFVVVRFGDNKELMANTDCMVCNLVDYLKIHTENYEFELDLASEQGELRGISQEGRYFEQAAQFLQDRESLVLVRVERMGEQMKNKVRYLPLLNDSLIINAAFLTNLAKQGPDSRKNYRAGKYHLPLEGGKERDSSKENDKQRKTPKSRERQTRNN
ncbi:uncharacterized protein CXorf65 homolog [Symsagittifera roscoffensis]|uniref:uncharacterized protein CXorf65 homolog n=1 Tax=Symsagittifera roscoffensis TaxID=84072 RepID=UPI00307B57BA